MTPPRHTSRLRQGSRSLSRRLLAALLVTVVLPWPAWAHGPMSRTGSLLQIQTHRRGLELLFHRELSGLAALQAARDAKGRTAQLVARLRSCILAGPGSHAAPLAWQALAPAGTEATPLLRAKARPRGPNRGPWTLEIRCGDLTPLTVAGDGVPGGRIIVTRPRSVALTLTGPALESVLERPRRDTDVLERIASGRLSLPLAVLGLLLAFLLGGYHALSPGHGKTLVAAYLVGAQARVSHALALAGIVTFTHTFSIAALAVGLLLAFGRSLPPWLLPSVRVGAGAVVAAVGLYMLVRRRPGHHHHHHPAPEHPDQARHHDRRHEDPDSASRDPQTGAPSRAGPHHGHTPRLGQLLAVGVSGGIVPCPTALVVLLAAVSVGRTLYGLALVASFSLGLAAVLAALGVLVVRASGWLERHMPSARTMALLPRLSGAAVTAVGLALAWAGLTALW